MSPNPIGVASQTQAHLDAFNAQHPDQMAAHLRGEHGMNLKPYEAHDPFTLKCLHYLAHGSMPGVDR